MVSMSSTKRLVPSKFRVLRILALMVLSVILMVVIVGRTSRDLSTLSVATSSLSSSTLSSSSSTSTSTSTSSSKSPSSTPSSPQVMMRGSVVEAKQQQQSTSTSISENALQCRFFLAESAMPMGGLAIYTAMDIKQGESAQSMSDICIYVADTPRGTAFETHSWSKDVFMGGFEGRGPRAACEGMGTLVNSMPASMATSILTSMKVHTNGGLHRAKNPGAGAISHYYGINSKALRDIKAGSELTIEYGDWEDDNNKSVRYQAPARSLEWLQKYGMCVDNIEIKPATDPEMGRGAFARRALAAGTLVAPAPLQVFPKRAAFRGRSPSLSAEALFVNYCFQPAGTKMLLYPYGPGVNLINHSRENPNVAVRWSTSPKHQRQWLDLPLPDFYKMNYPGALIMEVYALRDIQPGEELFLDYGPEWDEAWKKHVESWQPIQSDNYVYPADMDLSQPFRTVEEQAIDPYPSNLITVCGEENWDRDENTRLEWTAPKYWPEGLLNCHILKRESDGKGSFLYEVSLGWRLYPHKVADQRYIDIKVPHSAIMFADKPYHSDMHLKNAFRHPIGMPDDMVPPLWKSAR